MKKLTTAVLAGLVALLGLAVAAPAAQAYPEAAITFSVSPHSVHGGASVTGVAHASVTCDWTIAFEGTSRHGTGTTFRATFRTHHVSQRETRPIKATCAYDATASAGTASARSATVSRTLDVTVYPAAEVSAPGGPAASGSGSSGSSGSAASGGSGAPAVSDSALPNTGGPDLALIVGGVLLVLLGTAALYVVRRRRSLS